jgi:hypothetical protein
VLVFDQPLEGAAHGGDIGKPVKAVAALFQLTGGLRPAQHQHGHQSGLGRLEAERLVEELAVLGSAAAGAAGQTGPATLRQAPQCLADRCLVVLDDRVPVGRLVAGQPQGVQGERVGVRGRTLLLE